MTRWFRQLYGARVYEKSDCWILDCNCLTRIFEELHLVHSIARDAYVASDPRLTCDTYMWATLCCHEVMAGFVKYKFDDHPAMASTITRFTIRTSPITPMSKIKGEVSKLSAQVGTVTPLVAQVKSLQTDLAKAKQDLGNAKDEIKRLKAKVA